MKRALSLVICLIFLVSGIYTILKPSIETNLENKEALKQSDTILIGDVAADNDGVEFCVTGVENLKSIGSDFTELVTDNNFVVVTIKIVNNSNEPYDVNALDFSLIEGDKEYEHNAEAILLYENSMFIDTINPNLSDEYTIVYETPTTTDESEYKLKIVHNIFHEKDHVYITLKEVS